MKLFILCLCLGILSVLCLLGLKSSEPSQNSSNNEVVIERTLDSEIDRLGSKYNVSTTTIRAIIKCESQMYGDAVNRNKLPDGTVWSSDWGPLQINDYYHESKMSKLGLDIHNQFDSLEYGVMMMSKSLIFWSASRQCWSKLI